MDLRWLPHQVPMTEAEKREAERRELAMQMQLAAAEAVRVARAERGGGGGDDEAEHPHSSAAADPASLASSPSMHALTTALCPFPTGEAHAAADPASLASAMHMQNEMRHALVAQHARVIDLFRQWDTNGDGRIRKRELRKALAALGYHVPPYMCDADEL
jgi:hypothetical protein